MHPIIFRIPGLNMPIFGYGLMMVLAFLACQWLASYLAKRKGYNPEIFINATLIALVFGVIGCRMSSVLENLSLYTRPDLSIWQNFYNMINIRSGGLTFYGGLILAAPIVLGYFVYKKVPARAAIDICAPCIALGLAIGRIGCLLNGCCYGADASATLPWAIQFPYGSDAYVDAYHQGKITPPSQLTIPTTDGTPRLISPQELEQGFIETGDASQPHLALSPDLRQLAAQQHSQWVHPAEVYSSLNSFLIMALLLAYLSVPHVGGRVFALLLMTEGPTRFLLELLRVEPPVLGPMSLSMVLGLLLFVVGAILWLALGYSQHRASIKLTAAQPA
jgi:phosphatidylglycerol:prolipoprotein diacylglycerol transferase